MLMMKWMLIALLLFQVAYVIAKINRVKVECPSVDVGSIACDVTSHDHSCSLSSARLDNMEHTHE